MLLALHVNTNWPRTSVSSPEYDPEVSQHKLTKAARKRQRWPVLLTKASLDPQVKQQNKKVYRMPVLKQCSFLKGEDTQLILVKCLGFDAKGKLKKSQPVLVGLGTDRQ